MNFLKKILEILALLTLIAIFFLSTFSTLPNAIKVIILAGSLYASGSIVAHLAKTKSYHGLVILKGKYGFGLMRLIAEKHPKTVNALADLGLSIGFGAIYAYYLFGKSQKKFLVHLAILAILFAGASFNTNISINPAMLQIGGFLFGLAGIGTLSIAMNAFAILTIPETPAGVMPVVPGVTVPWEAIFAIVLIAVMHETAHGVLFFIEKLKVKHSGALLLGFLPIGAFVEPDEKKFAKHRVEGRRRILVAGSASNFYTIFALLPLAAIVFYLLSTMTAGVLITNITPGSPADGLLSNGTIITAVNGVSTLTLSTLVQQLQQAGGGPNGSVSLQLNNGRNLQTQLDSEGKLGIEIKEYVPPETSIYHGVISFFAEVLRWSLLLSLALAIINLMPLFITDGHHLITDEMKILLGNEQKAKLVTNGMGIITLLLILLNMLPFVL